MNVMMEIMLMVMDAQEIVIFNKDTHVQEDPQIPKILVMFSSLDKLL